MTKPSVAVIVPNYNHARFLPRRLDSILEQTVKPQQIVVLDDCSTDESAKLIQDYARVHSKIEFIPSEHNSGDPFSQWNKGIRRIQADYVWIAESDDWAESDFLEELLHLAQENPNAGIIYCHSDLVDESDSTIGNTTPHYADLKNPARWQTAYINTGRNECREYLVHRNIIPNASACLFKREPLHRAGLASSNFRLCGDWLTYVRILELSDIAYSPRTLNHYRVHNNSVRATSQKALTEIDESYKVLNYLKDRFEIDEANLEESRIRIFERFHFLLAATSLSSIETKWPDILAEASRFDPKFLDRLTNPSASTFHNVVVYFDEKGAFSEQRQRQNRIAPGLRHTLIFTDCSGVLRFDPISRAGVVQIYSISVLDPESQEVLWIAHSDSRFKDLRLAGTAKLLENSSTFLVYAYSGDPQLLLDGWSNSPNFAPDRKIELRVEMETGAALIAAAI